MITEEIASDFLAAQSRISHNESDISRSIKNPIIVEEEASIVTSSKIKKPPSNRRETLTDRALASNSIRTKSKTVNHLSRILSEYKGKNIQKVSKAGLLQKIKVKLQKHRIKAAVKNTSRSLTPAKSIKQENVTNANSNNSIKENSISSSKRSSFAMEELPVSKEDTMRKESLINTKEPEENHNEVQEVDDGPLVLSSSDNETTYLPVVSNSSSANEDMPEDNSEGSSSFKENDNVSVEYSSHWTEECDSTEISEAEMDESFGENSLPSVTEIRRNGESAHKPLEEIILDGNLEEFHDAINENESILQNVDENGWNLLHLSASRGINTFVEELLNFGIGIDETTNDGYTALHLAILNNHLETCKLFYLMVAGTVQMILKLKSHQRLKKPCLLLLSLFLKKYEDNLGKVHMIVDILNRFGSYKKESSSVLSRDLLKNLADLTLDEDEDLEIEPYNNN
ncbi:ANK_REP_REGION domain-containing protein [Caerostris extrusa]|uniref:ANK_REP_REGION domain-containing protein n=1 Tax=Caerostris extrusa TaxID=172846 RepID=A0AAV4M6V6_CAEEX|nr:ANK_REP_REGION domain-containing protein [Caerostris extrusa]